MLNSNWQLLQIVLTLPSLLFLSYWWVVPESVRWEISKVPPCYKLGENRFPGSVQ